MHIRKNLTSQCTCPSFVCHQYHAVFFNNWLKIILLVKVQKIESGSLRIFNMGNKEIDIGMVGNRSLKDIHKTAPKTFSPNIAADPNVPQEARAFSAILQKKNEIIDQLFIHM